LVSPHSVHAHSSRFTGAVLTFINIDTLINGEEEAWLTLAFRYMILAGAGTLATTDNAAGINAPVVGHLTHLVLSAVFVLFTLHFRTTQGRAWVTNMLLKAPAEGFVIFYLTVCIGATLGPLTGVHTLSEATLHHTGQGGSTVPVGSTFIRTCATLYKWVAHQSRGA
jgi:hypothetical protein